MLLSQTFDYLANSSEQFFRSMNSKDKRFRSCKVLLEAQVHQPLQIRTYKHRCFVFCPGHTSLSCVPGIGKKNESLLHRIGIRDLAQLFAQYRQINDLQRFESWLENHVGFSSYCAKMTTCGVAAKLGDIREINTGLRPICCPSKERRKIEEETKWKRLTTDSSWTNVSSIDNEAHFSTSTLDDAAAVRA